MIQIKYQIEDKISVDEFKSVLIRSTLGERRPIDNHNTLSKMIEHGNLIVTVQNSDKVNH